MRYWREFDFLAKHLAIRFDWVILVVSWCWNNGTAKCFQATVFEQLKVEIDLQSVFRVFQDESLTASSEIFSILVALRFQQYFMVHRYFVFVNFTGALLPIAAFLRLQNFS